MAGRSGCIAPILRGLHWLFVGMHVDHRVLSLVYNCIGGMASSTILCPVSSLHPQYWSGKQQKNTLESEHFLVLCLGCGSLPVALGGRTSEEAFGRNLRTCLFLGSWICLDCAQRTFFSFLLLLFFLKLNEHAVAAWTYLPSISLHHCPLSLCLSKYESSILKHAFLDAIT